MNGGVKAALLISCTGIGGCAAETNSVEVRPIANPSAVLSRGGDAVAVARGQLMLGNVGLALEGFRKAQRENPANAAALAGLGDCYVEMSRFDLAQSNYEAALALAPHDRTLLLGLAAVFERGGQRLRAIAVRAEANAAVRPAPVVTNVAMKATSTAASATAGANRALKATAALNAAAALKTEASRAAAAKVAAKSARQSARSVDLASEATLHPPPVKVAAKATRQSAPAATNLLASTQPAPPVGRAVAKTGDDPAPVVANVAAKIAPLPARAATNLLAKAPVQAPPVAPEVLAEMHVATAPPVVAAVVVPAPQPTKIPAPSIGSITVELPPARPVHRLEAKSPVLADSQLDYEEPVPSSSVTVALPPARPARPLKPERRADYAPVTLEAPAPRLERLSSGEVALVTTGKSIWNKPQNLLAAASSVRWVALARPGTRPNIQILNAARSQGLAASARAVLLDRGWRKLAIGDAPAVQAKSVVLYPKGREKLGKSLAAQFGVSARAVERDVLVLVLGRDSVDRVAGRRKS